MMKTPAERRPYEDTAAEDAITDHEILEAELTPTELRIDRLADQLLTAWTIVLEAERSCE